MVTNIYITIICIIITIIVSIIFLTFSGGLPTLSRNYSPSIAMAIITNINVINNDIDNNHCYHCYYYNW